MKTDSLPLLTLMAASIRAPSLVLLLTALTPAIVLAQTPSGADSGAGEEAGVSRTQSSGRVESPPKQVETKKDKKVDDGADVPSLPVGSSVSGSGIFGASTPAQGAVLASYETSGGALNTRHGAPIRWGGALLYPRLLLGVARNSNVIGANSNAGALLFSANVFSLQPELDTQITIRGNRYGVAYRGNYTRYSGYSAAPAGSDNFDNHNVELYGDMVLTGRSRLSWGVGYQRGSDPRGATVGVSALHSTPDIWRSPNARAQYSFGAKDAIGRIEVEAGYYDKRYLTSLADTERLNHSLLNLTGRFSYRVMPKTRVLTEVRRSNIVYSTPGTGVDDPRNSAETRYLIGATWEATAATMGSVKFGRMTKNFSEAGRVSGADSTWEASVRWNPVTRAVFDFSANRALSDGTGVGSYAQNNGYSLAWTHSWSPKLTSKVSLSNLTTTYQGAGREDESRNSGLKLNYELFRWLSLGVDFTSTTRSSNVPGMEFRRNVTMFTLDGSL